MKNNYNINMDKHIKNIAALFLLLLIITNSAFSQEDAEITDTPLSYTIPTNGIFIGLGPEINIYTRDGIALGGTLAAGYDFAMPMSAGLRVSFFYDFDTVSVLEIQALYRYFLPWIDGLFAEAAAGMMIAFEDGGSYPAFAGGLSAGYRIKINEVFKIDIGARFGYPYMGGFNVIAVYKFPIRSGTQRINIPGNEDTGEEDE